MFSKNHLEYYNYMNKTSFLGYIYRNFFLYPSISKHLKMKCLDIGCGLGNFAKYRKNTDVADINQVGIKILKKEKFKAYLIKNNKISVKNNSYDSLLMDNVLEHIEKPDKLLLECKRIIKPNGVFVIGVPGRKGFDSEMDHKVHYNEVKLISKLKKFKFKHLKTFYKPFNLDIFDNTLRQYCMYAVFKLVNND